MESRFGSFCELVDVCQISSSSFMKIQKWLEKQAVTEYDMARERGERERETDSESKTRWPPLSLPLPQIALDFPKRESFGRIGI